MLPVINITIDTTPPLPPEITSPINGLSINTVTPTIQGTAEPGVRVEIFVDSTLIGSADVSQGGIWSFTISSVTQV